MPKKKTHRNTFWLGHSFNPLFTDSTITLHQVRMSRNYYCQVWGRTVAEKVFQFLDDWGNLMQNDWTLMVLVNLYMVFDNEDTFYQDDQEFKSHCKKNLITLRHYLHVYCAKESKAGVLMNEKRFKIV